MLKIIEDQPYNRFKRLFLVFYVTPEYSTGYHAISLK